MPLFYPTVMVRRVYDITPALLRKINVRALLLDVDNTLTTHNHPTPHDDVLQWLETMREAGISLMLLSNNHEERVMPFAGLLEMDYTANAKKPLRSGFRRAAKSLGLAPREIAVVGDQIFTDILGGNRFGARTILVEPMQPEEGPFFRFKRVLERRILRNYCKKRSQNR